ncbi:Putative beta-lactamase/transpeptidase [Colletotrichum destructivum]|uniref:Beta-lactamase/transpeptidase n=1 Tax=Colletotrichum destructivum TaxID=34406 RepID=A0AAX4ICE8_9PEZI|nr:Putative beta-lactamase/transpeptidase [Colletotrichum destructivum]
MQYRLVVALLNVYFLYARAQPDVQTYFNLDEAAHATKTQTLKSSGYRILSLSSYGTPADIKYAAVWVKREGNHQIMISSADIKTYKKWLAKGKSRGYASTHVSATGPAKKAVFAGVMEKADVGKWSQECGLAKPENLHPARDFSRVVKDFSTYGTPNNRRYCVLVHENMGNAKETIFYNTNGPEDFAAIYNSELKKPIWRPAHLFVADDKHITPHFTDDWVGEWKAATDLTADELDAEIKLRQQGRLRPIHIDGAGTGKDTRFTVIFAETDVPEARKWTVTGKEGEQAMTERLDSIMQAWMKKNGVRQAQFAAAVKGEIILERSYTWAESNRAIVEPDDIFFVVSLSKMFTHAAVYNLIQAGKLDYSTRVYDVLGYKQAKDPRALSTTVSQLLDHSAGFDRSMSPDIGFQFREVSESFHNNKRPANLCDMIEFQLTKTLDFEPGSRSSYSNYGTMLLGYLITNITKQPYLDFLKENVLEGLDVRIYETAAEKHANDRIIQETRFSGLDATHPQSLQKVPYIFGGDGSIKEEVAPSFGLAASASTIARFIGRYAVWGTGEREVGNRQGGLPAARAMAVSEASGIDWAVTFNTQDFVTNKETTVLRDRLLKPLFSEPKSCFSWLRRFCAGV